MSRWKDRAGEFNGEITVHFLSTGYYDPGQTYGPPESCYPPEGEDERTLDRIEIDGRELPQELAEKLFEFLQDEVDAVEMDPPEDTCFDDDC